MATIRYNVPIRLILTYLKRIVCCNRQMNGQADERTDGEGFKYFMELEMFSKVFTKGLKMK